MYTEEVFSAGLYLEERGQLPSLKLQLPDEVEVVEEGLGDSLQRLAMRQPGHFEDIEGRPIV